MSDKWETVGKSPNAKKKAKAMPKIEDIVTKGNMNSWHEKPMYVEPKAKLTTQAPGKGAPEKKAAKVEPKKAKKEAAPEKPKVPKDIHEAVKTNLRLEDVKQLIDICQTRFPDMPVLWLRDLASYLNIKLVNQGSSEFDLVSGLPLAAFSQNIKKALVSMIQSLDEGILEVYVQTCVSNIVHEMAKNLSVLGWTAMAQVLAESHPQLFVTNISRFVELRNSYQNNPKICLPMLKALGEAGLTDLSVGIKLWLEMMLPLISLKQYTKFVVDYITQLLDYHKISSTSKVSKPVMDITNFLTLQDSVFIVGSQLQKDYYKQLTEQVYPRLKHLALAGYGNHDLFPQLMSKLKSQNMPNQVVDSLEILSYCMMATPAAIVHWQELYISQLAQSGYLLQYINSKWDNLKKLDTPLFRDTLQAFQEYNATVPQKQDVGLCEEGCASILSKIERQRSSGFYWKSMSVLCLLGLAAIVTLDVAANSTFDKTHVASFLRDAGQYERVCAIRDETLTRYGKVNAWATTNLPVYYEAAQKNAGVYYVAAQKNAGVYYETARKHAGPAVEQAADMIKVGAVYVQEQIKVIAGVLTVYLEQGRVYVEEQAPGILKSGEDALLQAKTHAVTTFETVKSKTLELVGDIDWVQVKEKTLRNLEQARTLCLQYVDKLVQQITQLVK